MRKRKKSQVRVSKFGKLLYTIAAVLLLVSPLSIVFSKATLAQINFEVEKEKKQIDQQTKKNESLTMAINELASLTKIQQVAQEQGLSYNNSNIKTIEEK